MPRPKKNNPDTDGLVPWVEVATKMNLPLKTVMRIYATALEKLKDDMAARELTFEQLAVIFHHREDNEYR